MMKRKEEKEEEANLVFYPILVLFLLRSLSSPPLYGDFYLSLSKDGEAKERDISSCKNGRISDSERNVSLRRSSLDRNC